MQNDVTITPQAVVKDLGVYISSNLSWTKHINIICDNARKMSAWVLNVFCDRSYQTMLTLYKSMIRLRLEYCCPLWNPT